MYLKPSFVLNVFNKIKNLLKNSLPFLFFIGLYLFCARGVAQELTITASDSLSTDSYRSQFVDDKTQLLGLSFFLRNRSHAMTVRGTQRLEYSPNHVGAIGVRVQHKWLGLAITYSPTFMQPVAKGVTDEIDLHAYIYGKRHNIDGYYLRYQGMYINNYTSSSILKVAYKSYPLLPEMQIEGAGLNYSYVFNHKKYSLRSTYLHNEVQKRSAGSFLLGTSINYFRFYNPTSILPNQLDSISQTREKLENGAFYVASVLPGYAHTFVYKRAYFTVAPMVGLALQVQHFNVESEINTVKRFSVSPRGMFRFGLGYNAELYYLGVSAVNDSYNYRTAAKSAIEMRVSDVRFILGYRFKPAGFVKKVSDKMDKVPIRI
jgi:hypothetical protein